MYDYKALYKFLEKKQPKEIQESKDGKIVKLYLLNEDESKAFIPKNTNSIFSNKKNEYRIAINEKFYNFKSIYKYFDKDLNLLSIDYVTKITQFRNRYLFPILIIMVVIFMIVTGLLLGFKETKDYAVYSLFGMFLVVISTLVITNKLLIKKTKDLNIEVNKKVVQYLGQDLYNTIRDDIEEFNKIKNNIKPQIEEIDEYEKNLLEKSNNQEEKGE